MDEITRTSYQKTARLCGILLFAIALFYAAVCTPIYQWSSADIAVSEIFTTVWDFVQSLTRFAFFWLSAAFLLTSVKQYGTARAILWLIGGAILLFHIGSLVAGLVMMHDLDTIGADLLSLAFSILLDLCQIALFRLIAYRTLEKRPTQTIPLRALWLCAILPTAVAVLGRLVFDLAYGAPTGKTDLIVMITYYLIDLANAPIGTLTLLLLTDRLSEQKEAQE